MMRAIMTAVILIASSLQLARADDSLLISPDIITFYNGTYQGLQPPKAMAVSADGLHMGYSYCPEHRCYIQPSASSLASSVRTSPTSFTNSSESSTASRFSAG